MLRQPSFQVQGLLEVQQGIREIVQLRRGQSIDLL
jgi:hypothetical protein